MAPDLPPRAIATGAWGGTGIAADADSVYWTDDIYGGVWKVARTGGTPVEIAPYQHGASGIAIDDNAVYFATIYGIMKTAK